MDDLLISKIKDKIKFCETRNRIETTSFLDLQEQHIAQNFLKSNTHFFSKSMGYLFTGGFEDAERKILLFYPNKIESVVKNGNLNINPQISVIRITLPLETQGTYDHKIYLGGLMKLGIEREKIGDIIVYEEGADIIFCPELEKFLMQELPNLKRFSEAKFEKIKVEELHELDIKIEEKLYTIPSMRVDNFVSEFARCSRERAVEILAGERVFVNFEVVTKPSKEIKEGDLITLRGKGRYTVEKIEGKTKKGRTIVKVTHII